MLLCILSFSYFDFYISLNAAMARRDAFFFCILFYFYYVASVKATVTPDTINIARGSWDSFRDRLGTVNINEMPISELLGPALEHNFTLPYEDLKRGIVFSGTNSRLRRAVNDLLSGGKVKFGVIGGSISVESNSTKYVTSWFTLFCKYISDAFPTAEIQCRNGALWARQSPYAVMCLDSMIDEDVDVVFVEYVRNDNFMDKISNNILAKSYETLIRLIAKKSQSPAVVLMQSPGRGLTVDLDHKDHRPFFETQEDIYGTLAQFYDIVWLSFRNVFWPLGQLHKHNYTAKDFYQSDYVHPNQFGQNIMGDIGAFLVLETALDLMWHPWSSAEQDFEANFFKYPMYQGNFEPDCRLCIRDEDFKSIVTKADGFVFLNEGHPLRPKWGYTSTTVGAQLEITLSTMQADKPKSTKVDAFLGYLKSYNNMGTAKVKCKSGCKCNTTVIQGHHEAPDSQSHLLQLKVTQSPKCVIAFTVLNSTLSGGHKVKISALMLAVDFEFDVKFGTWQTDFKG